MSEQKKARKPHQKNEAVIARMLRKRTEAFEKELRTAIKAGLDVTVSFAKDLPVNFDNLAEVTEVNIRREVVASTTVL